MGNEYNIRNILSNQKKNDEFYTPKETVEEVLDRLNLPLDLIVWCPFDTEDSEFVKCLKSRGYFVEFSHLQNGQDFYEYQPAKWDVILSNPPFSNKRKTVERCLSFKKPFHLLFGSTICSQSMGDTLNKCSLWFIQRNVKFTNADGSIKKFQCCWVSHKEGSID